MIHQYQIINERDEEGNDRICKCIGQSDANGISVISVGTLLLLLTCYISPISL